MRYIYLSPHLDDAVLSAGGLIHDQTKAGIPVEIWTFMCGFPNEAELTDFAKSLHQQWGTSSAEQTVRIRRAEDKKAASTVGAKIRHFDFLDCIYRRGVDGQALYHDIFVPPNPAEKDLPAQIAQTMIAWLKPDDVAVCQLAVGGHVDHTIVRKAAELLNRPMQYDADIPYLLNTPQDLNLKAAGLRESPQAVTETGLKFWLEAIEKYASQINMLFKSSEVMRQRMRGYWSERRGIRFWESA
jgi:LmbE family N-acetylglucosaminyl deacetylase